MKEQILEQIYNSKRNLIISGNMSTGKTTNINYYLIKKIIENKDNLLILDTKKEYLEKYYETLKKSNYNILLINFSDAKKSQGYNPLVYPYFLYKQNMKDETIKVLEQLSEEIFYDSSDIDPFWTDSAKDFFIGIILAMFEDGSESEINLISVNSLINEVSNNDDVILKYFENKDKNSPAYTCVSGIINAPFETKGGIISCTKQKLNSFIIRENLNYLLSKNTIDFNQLNNQDVAIFIICEEEDKKIAQLVPIFIKQIYHYLSRKNIRYPFYFILDNFDTIEHFANFKEILSSCIQKNIKYVLTTRDIEKIKKDYSDYIVILSNQIITNEKEMTIQIDKEEIKLKNILNNDIIK